MIRRILFRILKRIAIRSRLKGFELAKAEANRIHGKSGKKCLVFYTGKEFKVLTKEQIRNGKRTGLFKNMNYEQIEKRAVYSTS